MLSCILIRFIDNNIRYQIIFIQKNYEKYEENSPLISGIRIGSVDSVEG